MVVSRIGLGDTVIVANLTPARLSRFVAASWASSADAPGTIAFENAGRIESWSGHALRLAGSDRALAAFPAVRPDGGRNLNPPAGSIRFWFAPDWGSLGVAGGTGPGIDSELLQIGSWSEQPATVWWSLSVDPTGDRLRLMIPDGAEMGEFLGIPIRFVPGQWYQIALTWAESGVTELYVDGQRLGVGPGVVLGPPGGGFEGIWGFCVGSDMHGHHLAQGEFEEVYTFGRPLGAAEIAADYARNAPRAAMGEMATTAKSCAAKATLTCSQSSTGEG